ELTLEEAREADGASSGPEDSVPQNSSGPPVTRSGDLCLLGNEGRRPRGMRASKARAGRRTGKVCSAGAHTASRKATEEGTVHLALPPSQRREAHFESFQPHHAFRRLRRFPVGSTNGRELAPTPRGDRLSGSERMEVSKNGR